MTTTTLGYTLFVALAVLGIAFAAPAVVAHGDAPATHGAPTADANATERSGWLIAEMTDRLGPTATEWMASHAGTPGSLTGSSAHGDHERASHHSEATHGDHYNDTTPGDHHSDAAHGDHHSDTLHGDHHSDAIHDNHHDEAPHDDHHGASGHNHHSGTGTQQRGNGC